MELYEGHEITQEVIDFVCSEESDDKCAYFVMQKLDVIECFAWEIVDYIWDNFGREE